MTFPNAGAGSVYVPGVSSLSWWFAAHPAWEPGEDWPQEVPVVCYETDDEIVLIDPFLPQDGSFDPHGKRVRVLLTPHPSRDIPELAQANRLVLRPSSKPCR